MKRSLVVTALAVLASLVAFTSTDALAKKGAPDAASELGKIPTYFVENRGQVDKAVKFYAKMNDKSVYFTEEGIFQSFFRLKNGPASNPMNDPMKALEGDVEVTTVKLVPVGAMSMKALSPGTQLEGKINYITTSFKDKNIPTYEGITYKGVYEDVDMHFYGKGDTVEYDVIVKPGADPATVVLSYEGIKGLSITESGALEVSMKKGKYLHNKPFTYQVIDGERVEIESAFRLVESAGKEGNAYGFVVASYDKDFPLIIDPTLDYSTYFGGNSWEFGYGIASDNDGTYDYIYLGGPSCSWTGFTTTTGAYQESNAGTCDWFVTKMKIFTNATATLEYSTYIGGDGSDTLYDLKVDSDGNVYAIGQNSSNNFADLNDTYDPQDYTFNATVLKLNDDGSELIYLYGMDLGDESSARGIDFDDDGNAYVVGYLTASHTMFNSGKGFDTSYSSTYAIWEGFVIKVKSDCDGTYDTSDNSCIIYTSYIGGAGGDVAQGVAVKGSIAYVSGPTKSSDFPTTTNAYDTSLYGDRDIYLAKFDTGTAGLPGLLYSTYIGGSEEEWSYDLTLGSDGLIYVSGYSEDSTTDDYPTTTGAYHSSNQGGLDALVSIFDTSESGSDSLVYSTLIGGTDDDYAYGIAVDSTDEFYITGKTASSNFPNTDSTNFGDQTGVDAFVTKFNDDYDIGTITLEYSIYLGGDGTDWANEITLATIGSCDTGSVDGTVYISGNTDSSNSDKYPQSTYAYQSSYGGGQDAFVSKIDD